MDLNKQNSPGIRVPQDIKDALLRHSGLELQFVAEYRPKVPGRPDTIFQVFESLDRAILYTCVITDHPDPVKDSELLKDLSDGLYLNKLVSVSPRSDESILLNDIKELDKGIYLVEENNRHYYLAETLRYRMSM